MRATEFLTEWREDYLYHATSVLNAIDSWRADKLGGNSLSTTRNYMYALGYLKNNARMSGGGCIFWLNQKLLRQDIGRRRMPGTDWFAVNDPTAVSDEFQRRSDIHDTDRFETLITGGLSPLRKYVVKIEIWLPANRTVKPTPPGEDPMYRYRFKPGDDPNQHHDLSVNTQLMNNNWLRDPLNRKAWEAMKRDPRTEIKSELGSPRKYQGVGIPNHRQFDPDHQMYDPYYDDNR